VTDRQRDGRSARWDAHRELRRAELIGAAITAIAHHGPDVDMGQVAAVAGVTKPVLYRYFADKAELFTAVGDQVARNVLAAVTPAIARVREERALVAATIDAYLGAIDGQPELYAFMMSRADMPGVRRLVQRSSQTIAAGLARVIGDRLRSLGLDSGPAEPWAYGMVGMVQSVGDWWMSHGRPMSREALTDYLTTLLWEGLVGVRRVADVPGGLAARG
jgi:AcrR family transcriptional regulator